MKVQFHGVRVSKIDVLRSISISVLLTIGVAVLAANGFAQSPTGTLRGKVTDPSGAVIPGAKVSASSAGSVKGKAVSNNEGVYEIVGLAAGTYTVSATAKGFAAAGQPNVTISAGGIQQLDVALDIAVEQEKVDVQDQSTTVDVNPENNASSLILKGKDLDALSDDPDELQSELEALAGPSAGPNGGQIYIDGFTGGQLPPKSSIREIRINQNPFSAEYDKLGYGRIEIFTKPGTDKLHGQVFFNDNNSALNSPNPFAVSEPSYDSEIFNGSVSGPLGKKSSFFVSAQERKINDVSVVDATILDSNFNPVPFSQSIPAPATRTNISPRVDFQLSPNNTLTVRYQYSRESEQSNGVGQFSLASQASTTLDTEHTLQISDTQILGPHVVNETRFQFIRANSNQTAQNFGVTTDVLQAFTSGGSSEGTSNDAQNHYEFQNYTSVVHGNHLIKFGARLRGITDTSDANSDFNGTFTFPSIEAYRVTALGLHNGLTAAQSRAACLATSPDPATAQCGPSQFTITNGNPITGVSMFDAGLYVQDDWRIKPNLTFSYGLRFESQNQISDHADIAPRLGLAWGLGAKGKKPPKTVLRAGFGIFYDRFPSSLVLQAERLNGITQHETVVANPDFYPGPPSPLVGGGTTSSAIYQVAPGLQAPMTFQSAFSVERQVTKFATVAVTYLNSDGEHQVFIRNSTVGTGVNTYQYDSEGVFRQNQMITNVRVTVGPKVSLFGFYTLNYANSDTGTGGMASGGGGFSSGPSITAGFLEHQDDPMEDYGRASFDVRQRLFLGGSISLPYGLRMSPFIVLNSGQPFNVTVGQDLNGDSIFNDRPAFVSSQTCGAVSFSGSNACTPLGTFDVAPTAGQRLVPVNYGTGPTNVTANLRLSKTIGLGKKVEGGAAAGGEPRGGPGGGGGRGGGPGGGLGGRGLSGAGGNPFGGANSTVNRRYSLTFTVQARNMFNHVNLGVPSGNIDSPYFDRSNSLAGGPFSTSSANRRVDLQVMFSF